MSNKKVVIPSDGLFVYRSFMQNSLQATIERSPKPIALLLPRTGTSAPIGAPTITNKIIRKER